MKLKLTLRRPDGRNADLQVTLDASAPVGGVADALARRDPMGPAAVSDHLTLVLEDPNGARTTLDPTASVAQAGVRSGSVVALAEAPAGGAGRVRGSVALLTVYGGPDQGKAFELKIGANTIGRDPECDVVLDDPMVSKRHAKVHVGDVVEVVDENSSNGVLLGGDLVQRAVLRPHDLVTIGDTVLGVSGQAVPVGAQAPEIHRPHNRSPRLDPPYVGPKVAAPEPPQPPQKQRMPLIMALAPMLMGGILYAITRNIMSVLFVAMSPLMMLGSYVENRLGAKKDFAEAIDLFRVNLADLVVRLQRLADEEREHRRREHPSTDEVVTAVGAMAPLLWTRRPEHASFLELRLGLGTQPSRTEVDMGADRNSLPELRAELHSTVARFATIDHVPVPGSFRQSGSIGVSGSEELRLAVARGLVAQLVGLHSPAELVLCGLASTRTAAHWDWLKWLPHVGSDFSPLGSNPLASTETACANLVAELEDLIEARAGQGRREHEPAMPPIVVLVEDDAPVTRSMVVDLGERGREQGVHLLWLADTTAGLPATCRTYLELEPDGNGPATGKVIQGERVQPVVVEPIDAARAELLGRFLAPVIDANARSDAEGDIPSSVSFLAEAGIDLGDAPEAVLDRWKESNSVHLPGEKRKRSRRDAGLRALVGRGVADPLHLDLRAQGPHALVGGTTGAGKSEFLQTWILGIATAHGPQRVTFLFVDYKGGAAFADCVSLPHCVGLVTDLSPHLVRRALTSLNAELRHREHILNRKKAKDLLELERRGDPDAPPSLVIVVDEFAALVQEVPEFVDGVVNVAQRGRSLGLHLILATQRPAGVIKDNLRANTNLRVALRMADEDDSRDVVGTPQAATFDPGLPGRAIAKTGPGRLTAFQSGYVGGWTSGEPPPPRIDVATLAFGTGQLWEEPDDGSEEAAAQADPGPTDISRVVRCAVGAAELAGIDPPRKPWLPDLAHMYELAELPTNRKDNELVFGVLDDPEAQAQPVVAFRPDVDGNMAVYGTGGAGKSTFLRSLAVAAGLTVRGGPCHVYGMDFGSRGLQMLEALPHVGSIVAGDDAERIARLIRKLRQEVDERARRFAAVNAGSIEEYRELAGKPDEPRLLLLVDGMGAFRNAYEMGPTGPLFESFLSVAADGRPVGVHVIVSADRGGAVPTPLASSIQKRLVLRMTNEMDLVTLGVPADGFDESSPPGRGFMGPNEVQVGVFGGDGNVVLQAEALDRLARSMRKIGASAAPPVQHLPEHVRLSELPVEVDGRPAFGLADETLGPIGFDPSTSLLIVGPPRSGKSTTVATLVEAHRRMATGARFAYLGNRRSPLATAAGWDFHAVGPDAVGPLATELTQQVLADDPAVTGLVVILDGIGEFLNSSADFALQELLKACRSNERPVIAEGETTDVTGSWPLLQLVKAGRHGIALQPDQLDGDSIFGTPFPRLNRLDFPAGRGLYVRTGRVAKVQVAEPV